MEKFKVDSKDDIAEEPYKGPSIAVAAAGEGFLRHFAWAVVGIVVGGVASSLAYNKVGAVKEAFQEFHGANREHAFFLKRWAAKAAGLVVTIAHGLTGHIPGHQHIVKHIPEKRLEATLFGGGLLGAIGYASGWISALFTGTVHSNAGKRQFERAKAEIKDLRERNDDLEKINDELHAKYVEAATRSEQEELPGSASKPTAGPVPMEQAAANADHAHAHPASHTMPHNATLQDPGMKHHDTPAATIHPHGGHGTQHHGRLHAHAPAEQRAQAHA